MKPTITICSSANFYKHVVELQEQLKSQGYTALIPHNALEMKKNNDYDAGHYRTWLEDAKDYNKKTKLMRLHFDEIEKGDAVLVVNDEKHGRPGYIGGNVLIEIALAFYLHKPIYLMNAPDPESPYLEEILGMGSIVIKNNLDLIKL